MYVHSTVQHSTAGTIERQTYHRPPPPAAVATTAGLAACCALSAALDMSADGLPDVWLGEPLLELFSFRSFFL